ncbi:MAG: hypothetical protein MUC71_09295 [Steroidobacteraceae bacterium]|nr:hypothetical protein [Steroidobacteraceae bacterium]
MTLTAACRVGFLAMFLAGVGVSLAVASDVRPMSNEQCVARCDEESDRCMSKADTESKAQACDDEYSKCLEKCR